MLVGIRWIQTNKIIFHYQKLANTASRIMLTDVSMVHPEPTILDPNVGLNNISCLYSEDTSASSWGATTLCSLSKNA